MDVLTRNHVHVIMVSDGHMVMFSLS